MLVDSTAMVKSLDLDNVMVFPPLILAKPACFKNAGRNRAPRPYWESCG
jgi:hypothetical protein